MTEEYLKIVYIFMQMKEMIRMKHLDIETKIMIAVCIALCMVAIPFAIVLWLFILSII